MALLTADDVYHKQFMATKFREGYDQDEVDDFLDEVVETIATLQDQNQSLKTQIDEARQAVANGEPLPALADNSELHEARQALEAEKARADSLEAQLQAIAVAPADSQDSAVIAQLQTDLAQVQAQLAQAKQENQGLREQINAAPTAASSKAPEDATSMLALAQRVHDEYVANGQEEAQKIISSSREEGQRIVEEANAERDRISNELSQFRDELEGKIDELKAFEADYRNKVRSHLQNLLEQVQG